MSDESQALVPSEVRTVDFYGDAIAGALVRSDKIEQIYVPIRPICDYLGLSWAGQRERMTRDDVLVEALRAVRVTRTPGTGGGTQEMLCLPLDLLPGFLFGVTTARVKPELREKITRYRRECFRVLWEAFKPEIQSTDAIAPHGQSGAAIAYELATAVQHMARQQLDFEQRLDKSARWARGIEDRVTALELHVHPQEHISEAQAAEVALVVKNVAHMLVQSGAPNGYQQVYGELYRRFGISSYKNLPSDRYDSAILWLRMWYEELGGKSGSDLPV